MTSQANNGGILSSHLNQREWSFTIVFIDFVDILWPLISFPQPLCWSFTYVIGGGPPQSTYAMDCYPLIMAIEFKGPLWVETLDHYQCHLGVGEQCHAPWGQALGQNFGVSAGCVHYQEFWGFGLKCIKHYYTLPTTLESKTERLCRVESSHREARR